jgi:SPP1 Gp6-like portal protein
LALSAPTIAASSVHIAYLDEQAEGERLARYKRAWAAYDGETPDSLETEFGEADDNIRLDYAKLIVDKGVSFLVGKEGGVTLQCEPPDSELQDPDEDGDVDNPDAPSEADEDAEADAALAALDSAWPPEQRQVDFHNLATNGGICGHAWLRLSEDGGVTVLDPANVSVTWDEDDFTVLQRYIVQWNTVDREDGMGCVRRLRIEPDDPDEPSLWMIYEEEHNADSSSWIMLDETTWAHSFAPIAGAQNLPSPNTYYGLADLEPAILGQIEQLESVASDMRRIVRLHGHPVPVIIGEDATRIASLNISIGSLVGIPNPDAKLAQLAVAEIESSLNLYEELKTSLFEVARIPKVALGDTANAGPTTGVALRVEYEPLIEKTATKRVTYGLLLVAAAERILALRGFEGWSVSLGWPELLTDEEASAQNDEAELRMGIVSKQTIAEKRGYDWSVEAQRIAEEKPNFEAGTYTFTGGSYGGEIPPGGSPPIEGD